jgi:hypothetical protein
VIDGRLYHQQVALELSAGRSARSGPERDELAAGGVMMETYQCKYARVDHSQAGVGWVAFELFGEGGHLFQVMLPAEKARELISDLQEQIEIAEFGRPSPSANT